MSDVRLEIDGNVARVTIDRPDSMNAVAPGTERELRQIWERIERDRDVRVVVLTGAGERAFCTGADMGDDEDEATEIDYWADRGSDGFGAIALRTTLDVPVIARVNGYALGGGLEMVLGCDLVVAADHAQLGLPEPRVGRMPLDGGMTLLPRKIPRALAMELLLTGKRVTASEAYRMGLVNVVVPGDELDSAVDAMVADILACAPSSIRAIKQFVRRTEHLAMADAEAARVPAVIDALRSGEGDEGVRAFIEKRPPSWKPEEKTS